MTKHAWSGTVTAVQPRISLWRSFDERSHTYLGYVLRVFGEVDDAQMEFAVAIGPGAQEKHQLHAGCDAFSLSLCPIHCQETTSTICSPPWPDIARPTQTSRQRGHRRTRHESRN